MADIVVSQRVDDLVKQANKLLINNDRGGAAKAAREALQLQPQHTAALQLLQQVQSAQSTCTVVKTVEAYTTTWLATDGAAVSKAIEADGSTLDERQAELCLTAFLERRQPRSDSDGTDLLFKQLLKVSPAAQRVLARRFEQNLTITFKKLWELGEQSIVMMLSLAINKTLWPDGKQHIIVLRGLFQLLLTKLIEAGQENTMWAASGMIMLLQMAPNELKDLCDSDAFTIILENMDIRCPEDLRKSCMGAMKLMLDVTGEAGQQCLKTYVTAKFTRGNNEDLILAFSAASATFPLLPGPAARLFLTEGFLQTLIPKLQSNTRNTEDRRSHKLEQSALQLISAACQDKACRAAVVKYCVVWLEDVAETGTVLAATSLAALILAKTHTISDEAVSQFISRGPEHLCEILTNMLLQANGDQEVDNSVEGLSYLAMDTKVKEAIVNNEKLLQKLVQLLRDAGTDRWVVDMACLTIFSFLTQYREKRSEEQQKVEQLKAYSEASRPMPEDPLDDDEHVRERCRKLLATDAIPAMLARIKSAKDSHLLWITRIVLAMAQEPKVRGRLSQLGAVRSLIAIHTRLRSEPGQGNNAATLTTASHALAKILISVNPNHTFSSSLAATTCVRPLADLLDVQSDERVSLLATFEALLALTNLASMEAEAARELVIRDFHEQVFDLVLSDNRLVSRAATELICNLMASPQLVTLYADGSRQAKHRLVVLLAVTDSMDGPQRLAAGGALAQLTEWDKGVEAVLDQDKHVKRVLGMCQKEEEGKDATARIQLAHRGLACLMNLVEAPGPLRDRGRKMVKEQGGKAVIEALKQDVNGRGQMEDMVRGLADTILQKLA